MTYPLTVNRVMGLCAFSTGGEGSDIPAPRSHTEILSDFQAQLAAISDHTLSTMFDDIAAHTEALSGSLEARPAEYDELDFVLTRDTVKKQLASQLLPDEPDAAGDVPVRDPLIGKFRARRYSMKIGDYTWNLQVRPSVTACLLESDDRLAKLWLTFEGVPEEGAAAADDKAAYRFVETTTSLAEAALPKLREGYAESLHRVTKRARAMPRFNNVQLRVTLADTVDTSFSRLVDAMNIRGFDFNEAAEGAVGTEPKAGADGVVRFVTEVNKKKPDLELIEATRGQGGTAAVFAQAVEELNSTTTAPRYVISGLASSIGLISNSRSVDPEWKRATTTPELLRSISAARPLSAWLADSGARSLDRRLAADLH